jgi:hypothetical protein
MRSTPIGRLIYTDNALPAMRPVTFAAPEAGTLASSTRSGWTVLVIGRARLVAGTDGRPGFDDPTRAP